MSSLWTEKALFTREGVFSVDSSHLWAQDNPHVVRECGYEVHFSISVWVGIIRNIVMDPLLLLVRLTAEQYCDFLETVLLVLHGDMPLALRQSLWFHCDGAPTHCGEDVWQWLNATYWGKWIGHQGSFAWATLVIGSDLMDTFSMGTSEGTNYVVPPRTIEYLVVGLQAAVVVVDGKSIRHIWDNAIWHTAVYLETNGHHWMAIVTTRRSWFDQLIACAI
jgi:hypothetical protein